MSAFTKINSLLAVSAMVIGILAMGQGLDTIPGDITFSCEGRSYGYYADPSYNCQVFHICLGSGEVKWSFLCPNNTIFNQQYFVCDYEINVDCAGAETFYSLNANFGEVKSQGEEDGGIEEA